MKRVFAAYLGQGSNYTTVYGTLAAIPIFLVWIYSSWVVVVLGAQVVALAPDYHHASLRMLDAPRPALHDFFKVLAALVRAQAEGAPLARARIGHEAGLPSDMTDSTLDALAAAGWVGAIANDRWALVCDPDRVTLAEVRERMLRRPGEHGATGLIAAAIAAADEAAAGALNRPLRALIETRESG